MISIIIPCYNGEKWLAEAIESALNQKEWPEPSQKGEGKPYDHLYEIIIVDDGSTDSSLEIAKKYQKENDIYKNRQFIKVISQVNKGLASARNTGIMNSDSFSEWILPLDADDILKPNCLDKILWVQSITKGEIDIIGLSFKCFGLSEQEIILMSNPTIEDFKTANRIGYCSIIRRSALLEVGGYNSKMRWGAEDYDLWFDLLKRGKKLVTIPEVLWMYRTKEKSMWTETQRHYQEFMHQIVSNHPEVWQTS